ncbi:hypothetical protein Hanom_Chr13g01222621 [Helianthus anomalus]
MSEQMITYISRNIGSTMTIINSNKRPKRTRFNLALIFKHLVRLNYSHRVLPVHMLSNIMKPQQPIFPKITVDTDNSFFMIMPEPTHRTTIYQFFEHPTSLAQNPPIKTGKNAPESPLFNQNLEFL